ncbi:MAG: hypothetical protein EOO77_24850 [Oxalobacteraceae bacterium]|nr:MAG: hypothetical protein EOO77_24850 [Oxalobacteraceae bacterium]
MKIVYALQPLQKSIMLLGPTPRHDHVPTWRPEALQILERIGFDGTVFVPEASDWAKHDLYDAQVSWEWEALEQATVRAFWIPRNIAEMPGFTSNVEFGMSAHSGGRTVLGAPSDAPKMGYLYAMAERYHIPVYSSLQTTLEAAVILADAFYNRAVKRA